jgi:hypothetical protein
MLNRRRRVLGSSVLAEILSSQKIRDRESAIINTRGRRAPQQ